MEKKPLKTLALYGCGKLSAIVVEALNKGLLDGYTLTALYSRTQSHAEKLAEAYNGTDRPAVCGSVTELVSLRCDYIVEAASPAALKELAPQALAAGSSIVALSTGAFADTGFQTNMYRIAKENGTKIYIVSGAVGGFDVLRTVALMSSATGNSCSASIATEKGPASLQNTPVYTDTLQTEKRTVFSGNAEEAIALFPTKVNVAVASSLASVGPANMHVSVTSTPGYTGDDHRIDIQNDEVHAVIDIYSKTSRIAGWSVVQTLRNITEPFVF